MKTPTAIAAGLVLVAVATALAYKLVPPEVFEVRETDKTGRIDRPAIRVDGVVHGMQDQAVLPKRQPAKHDDGHQAYLEEYKNRDLSHQAASYRVREQCYRHWVTEVFLAFSEGADPYALPWREDLCNEIEQLRLEALIVYQAPKRHHDDEDQLRAYHAAAKAAYKRRAANQAITDAEYATLNRLPLDEFERLVTADDPRALHVAAARAYEDGRVDDAVAFAKRAVVVSGRWGPLTQFAGADEDHGWKEYDKTRWTMMIAAQRMGFGYQADRHVFNYLDAAAAREALRAGEALFEEIKAERFAYSGRNLMEEVNQ